MAFIIMTALGHDSNAQSLEVSGELFLPQDSIGFTYESPDFDPADWIGIYHIDDVPGRTRTLPLSMNIFLPIRYHLYSGPGRNRKV